MSDDRTVHAGFPGLEEIVRYDRAGKWYIEIEGGARRKHIGVREAARRALELRDQGGRIYLDLPGGQTFDHHVRRFDT